MPLGFEPGKADDRVVDDVAKLMPELRRRPGPPHMVEMPCLALTP